MNEQYVFDNAAPQTRQRFQSLEALYDPRTRHFLEATGIGPGWRCLEVGAGSGSIASWLADTVGPSGHVLVTDIDGRYLETLVALACPNVEVRNHDVAIDPLPEAAFDLIHARLVLIHVPQREAALAYLVNALKPGGWIVVEDFDPIFIDRGFPATDPEAYAAFAAVRSAMGRIMERHGVEHLWARSLYRRFVSHGLRDVGLEGHFAARQGGSLGALLERTNIEQVRAEMLAAGLVTDLEIDHAMAVLEDPGFAFGSPVMMTAWGRRP